MRCFVVTLFAACAALSVAGQALAQAPTPAPAAPVPDQMPFDIPYGPAITADQAAKVVAAAVEEAKKSPRNWKLAIAVVDPNETDRYVLAIEHDGGAYASSAAARLAFATARN